MPDALKRAYVLLYNDDVGTRDEIKNYLSDSEHVIHWRYDLPNSFYIISNSSAQELAEAIQGLNNKRGMFLVTEISTNKQGWLLRDAWTLLNTLEHGER